MKIIQTEAAVFVVTIGCGLGTVKLHRDMEGKNITREHKRITPVNRFKLHSRVDPAVDGRAGDAVEPLAAVPHVGLHRRARVACRLQVGMTILKLDTVDKIVHAFVL